jgi:hypothetical protein
LLGIENKSKKGVTSMALKGEIIVTAIVTILTSIITAYVTIKVAEINSRKSAQRDSVSAEAVDQQSSKSAHMKSKLLNVGTTNITARKDGTLIIAANASANGGGDFRSYLDLTIEVDGKPCGQTRSYVPVNWEIGHLLNATCVLDVLTDQTLSINLKATGEGIKQTSVSGSYVVVSAAQPGS